MCRRDSLDVFTGLVYTYASSKEKLDQQVMRIISVARQSSIEVDTYDYRQRRGLNSVLPLGHNHVEISRMFTTAQVSILVPFATQELDDKGGNYYGPVSYTHLDVYKRQITARTSTPATSSSATASCSPAPWASSAARLARARACSSRLR